jgi:septal ring factor EnvC (AmiA/AmiB activator)
MVLGGCSTFTLDGIIYVLSFIIFQLTARNDRIAVLQKQIKWIEEHYHQYPHRLYININNGNKDNNNNIKQLRQELADLIEEDAKADRLRSLPFSR